MSAEKPSATILTIGTEITSGVRLDTNTRSIAQMLSASGYRVTETFSVADLHDRVTRMLDHLCKDYDLVVTTGGLGPTHDDLTLAAAADVFGLTLARNSALYERLCPVADAQLEPVAAEQVLRQAVVPVGAKVLMPTIGTAPGLIIPIPKYNSTLALLPGPPAEMLAMLHEFIGGSSGEGNYRVARCVGISESDAQILAQKTLSRFPGIDLTILASPGDVRLMLINQTGTPGVLDKAIMAISEAFGTRCYSTNNKSLPEAVVDCAREAKLRIATAESCTGGSISSAITSVPGASEVFIGGVVAYDDSVKSGVLKVDRKLLAEHGAVSTEVAQAMAKGALALLGADVSIAVSGIAGPGGGTPDKPVGLVVFAIAISTNGSLKTTAFINKIPGDRERIRERSTVFAMDLLRRTIMKGEVQ